nr:hypothetical protein OG409_18365 [Streptomyces sp. NBC_00974]
MTPHDELRLLPWSGPDGKPCFLSADDSTGYLSRLADNTEAMQLGLGSELLDQAVDLLADQQADPSELRLLATDLAVALRNAVRVATSRGHRLAIPTPSTCEAHTEAARRPAASD